MQWDVSERRFVYQSFVFASMNRNTDQMLLTLLLRMQPTCLMTQLHSITKDTAGRQVMK